MRGRQERRAEKRRRSCRELGLVRDRGATSVLLTSGGKDAAVIRWAEGRILILRNDPMAARFISEVGIVPLAEAERAASAARSGKTARADIWSVSMAPQAGKPAAPLRGRPGQGR